MRGRVDFGAVPALLESMTEAATAADPILLSSEQEGIAILTLNRPRARNALSTGLMTALEAELTRIRGRQGEIFAVVLRAEGPAFCAGHDLKEMRQEPREETFAALFAQCSRLMTAIVRLPQPVIAEVHGIATAAGCQLVASCDLAVAADDTRFATPGVNIGLFCSTPMVALSRNVSRKAAMEMLLTGDMVSAQHAQAIGLINRTVPAAELHDAAMGLARQIAAKSPLTVAVGKEAFYRQLEMDLDAAYAYASEVMTRNMMAKDAEEGIDAFLQKRAPVWKGE